MKRVHVQYKSTLIREAAFSRVKRGHVAHELRALSHRPFASLRFWMNQLTLRSAFREMFAQTLKSNNYVFRPKLSGGLNSAVLSLSRLVKTTAPFERA